MEALWGQVATSLITLLGSLTALAVAYIAYLIKKIKQKDHQHNQLLQEKEATIKEVQNGWRTRMENDITIIKKQLAELLKGER